MNFGVIKVSSYMVENDQVFLSEVFASIGFVPIDIDIDFPTSNYLYKGKSEAFDVKVPEGYVIPHYQIVVTKDKDGTHYKVTK